MRVWPMLRGLIGAITVFTWGLLAIGPSHKVKDGAVGDLHHDILSASQPLSRKTLSKLADASDSRIGEGRASRDSSQLGSAPGQALRNDRDATALPGTSQDLSGGPQTSGKAELENSRPERADTLNPPETANRDASRSSRSLFEPRSRGRDGWHSTFGSASDRRFSKPPGGWARGRRRCTQVLVGLRRCSTIASACVS